MKMKLQKKSYDPIFENFKESHKDIEKFGKKLGVGAFGEVREVLIDNKIYAAKLVEKERRDIIDHERLMGPNIIKIIKILEKKIDNKYYDLFIMEKAVFKDLGTLFLHIFLKNLLKLINSPFYEVCSDNILRFFSRQIVLGLETLNRNNLIHFDIKPENLLITTGLTIKISDFSFLKFLKNDENTDLKIPGGTNGYISPEYFNRDKISAIVGKKQDYFALGSTIYFLKYFKRMIRYKIKKAQEKDTPINLLNKTHVLDALERSKASIISSPFTDDDLTQFLCGLTEYNPEKRYNFEQIYRNKWLNKNKKQISNISSTYLEGDEEKLMVELVKSNFLIQKKNEIKKTRAPKFRFILKMN